MSAIHRSARDLRTLFLAQEAPAAGVDQDRQPTRRLARVHYMPAQLAGERIVVQQISDLGLGVFVQELAAAVLLGDFEGLIGIDLEEVQVPGLRGTICGIEHIFDAVIYPAFRAGHSRPDEGLRLLAPAGRKDRPPGSRFAVVTVALASGHGRKLDRGRVRRPHVSRGKQLLQGKASGLKLVSFGLTRGVACGSGSRFAAQKPQGQDEQHEQVRFL